MARVIEHDFSTVLGEYLYGIESRNLAKDFPAVFSKTSVSSEKRLILLPEENSTSVIQVPAALEELRMMSPNLLKIERSIRALSLEEQQ